MYSIRCFQNIVLLIVCLPLLVHAEQAFVGTEQAEQILQAAVEPNFLENTIIPAPDEACVIEECISDAPADDQCQTTPCAVQTRAVPVTSTAQPAPKKKTAQLKTKSVVPEDAVRVDGIKVIIITDEGTEVILQSDLDRPGLGGVNKPLDIMVFERLVFADAKRFKALPDDNAIDKYISRVMRENNLTKEDLTRMFAEAGYSYDEGREELRRLQAVNVMLSQRVYSNVIVSRKEVTAYYNAHPERVDEQCLIARVVVPYATGSKEKQKKIIQQKLTHKKYVESLSWSQPFWISQGDVAQEKAFIFQVPVSHVSEPHELEEGFELFRVIEKKDSYIRSLEECYHEIADLLARPKYDELLEKYRKNLTESASIVYL